MTHLPHVMQVLPDQSIHDCLPEPDEGVEDFISLMLGVSNQSKGHALWLAQLRIVQLSHRLEMMPTGTVLVLAYDVFLTTLEDIPKELDIPEDLRGLAVAMARVRTTYTDEREFAAAMRKATQGERHGD